MSLVLANLDSCSIIVNISTSNSILLYKNTLFGLTLKIHKEFICLKTKSTNNPIKKMGRRPEQYFSKEKKYRWPTGT